MITRRAALALPVLALAGCSLNPGPDESVQDGDRGSSGECVAPAELRRLTRVGDARLVYELTERTASFRCDRDFAHQLSGWLTEWNALSGLRAPTRLWTYGIWVDGGERGCASLHSSGRALDISRLRAAGRTIVSCRTDLWPDDPVRRAPLERRYWAMAASLHLHFAYVLTHLFDAAHANHIHVDNSVSRGDMSHFMTRSRVQNQAVSSICRHLWGIDTPVSDTWDAATRAASTDVLRRLDRRGDLRRVENWQAFLRASAARAA